MDLELGQVLTQIVAFLIMLWVLKRFAWKPLFEVMDARQQKIHDEFDAIAKQKEELQALAKKYEDQLQTIQGLAHQKIHEAVKEGLRISADIQNEAKERAKNLLTQMQQELAREVTESKMRLKNDLVKMTIEATQKMIRESLTPEKQNELVAYFAERTELK
jgi:F-type H+-transporting ATPase subunit b